MLRLKDIQKIYLENSENEVRALKGVSLCFRECEFVSILGQSGCGKTTLLNLIGGLDRATYGEIVIDGKSTLQYTSSDWDTYRNQKIGFVFQSYNLIPHLNILTNVELALTISGVGAEERTRRAKDALEAVGLKGQEKKLPSQISGGQAQRVAIARAIVNDPSILLADEPTGAIDSETSLQIMELLKKISEERLVIMVTHNIELAEKYSTRIIRVLDGEVIGDSDPYDPDEEASAQKGAKIGESEDANESFGPPVCVAGEGGEIEGIENAKDEVYATNTSDEQAVLSKDERKTRRKSKRAKDEQASAAMPFFTAFKLSLRNLVNKLGRSIITAVAGSIGIICIAIILAVNNGFSVYIAQFEKQSMSKYPITVSVSNEAGMAALYSFLASASAGLDDIDITSLFDIIDDGSKSNDRFPDEELVHVYSQLGGMLRPFLTGENKTKDISRFKRYVDENFDSKYADVKYDYGVTLNIFTKTTAVNEQTGNETSTYTQISPLSESNFIGTIMETVMTGVGGGSQFDAMREQIDRMLEQFAFWDELVGSDETILTQYDVLAGHLPQNMNEVVLVINDYNQISDFYALALNEMGLGDFVTLATNPMADASQYDRTFESVLNEEESTFYVLPTSYAYQYNALTRRYDNLKDRSNPLNAMRLNQQLDEHSIPVHVSGILRAKEGMSGCINGVIGYSSELGLSIIKDANDCDYVKAQQEQYQHYLEAVAAVTEIYQYMEDNDLSPSELPADMQARLAQAITTTLDDVTTGEDMTVEQYVSQLAYVNVRNLDQPERIYFYANSVDYKSNISRFISDFNSQVSREEAARIAAGEELDTTNVVEFSDDLDSTVTELHSTVTLITYVLIGIALVSVVVTMFLIAIIMSISVQDRTREIGILRALGARKLDIANVFNAETAVLGLLSGLFGMLIAFILQYPGNILCSKLLGIGSVMQLAWWHPLVLIAGSILLTVIAGFIPAISAAKKDPVIALRSE